MNALAERLRAEHRNFDHVLQLIYSTTRIGRVDDPAASQFLTNAILYLQKYGDEVHNEKDSALIRRLLVADPSLWPTARRMLHLRQCLCTSECELHGYIADAKSGDTVACQKVKDGVAEFCPAYMAYIELEEREVLPAVLDRLRERDWRETAERLLDIPDPVFGRDARKAHPTPYDAIMAFSAAG